ncbi:MAG TPA: hypothetical protein DCM05_01900 [Elusimicrobia bacterium]|nr:hypothetical protein [Elusimicrobiota bacterium]
MRLFPLLCALALTSVRPAEGAAARAEELIEVPSGTLISVELVDPVNSGKSKAGDLFRARLTEGVSVRGQVVLPPGTTLRGAVAEAVPSGRIRGRSKLGLSLGSLELDGKSYALHTDTLSYAGEGHSGSNIGAWLGGALQGALYGVLFGGTDGAMIGAGAGAAAGGAAKVIKGKQDVDFQQGAKLLFEMKEPVSVPAVPAAAPPAAKPAS